MPESQDTEPTQTTPKGLEIPVPTRAEWEANLKKVAPPAEGREATSNSEGQNDE